MTQTNTEIDYLDINHVNPDKVMEYEKSVDEDGDTQIIYNRIGLLSEEPGKYHKYCGFNQFTKQAFSIPSKEEGWKDMHDTILDDYENYKDMYSLKEFTKMKLDFHKKWVNNHVCDPATKIFNHEQELITDRHTNFKMYKTLDNRDIGFIVLIGKENDQPIVYVYGRTKDVIPFDSDWGDIKIFTTLIKKYNPVEIFIGKSEFNEMTNSSGGYGDKWDGNSILLRIGSKLEFRYTHIGIEVFEFTTDEKITGYVSSVGNNCVPSITDHKDRKTTGCVSYVDNAKYESFDIIIITNRDTDNIKSPASCSGKIRVRKLKPPGEISLMENTCENEQLAAVQHVNNILSNDEQTEQSIQCQLL
jgi:hypothetical protein